MNDLLDGGDFVMRNYTDRIIEKGSKFINDNPHIIKQIYKDASYNDDPKVYSYGVYFKDKYRDVNSEDSIASGVSFDKKRALLKALGETIERYSLGINNNKKFIFNSFNGLGVSSKLALDPKSVISFSNRKSYSLSLEAERIHWVEGKSLIFNKKIFVPAQLVYVPYLYEYSESLIRFPTSTGAAAGSSLREAIYRGICEIAESDAFMIAYLNKLPSPRVDLSSIKNEEIQNILNLFKRYKLECIVLDVTTNLQIPAVVAITLDKTGLGPAVSVGLKAGFNIKDAIIGAIEESLMVRYWVRDKFIYLEPNYKRGKEIITIEDRAHFWFPVSSIKYLNFWLNNKNLKKINIKDLDYLDNKLGKTINCLREKKMEVIYVDITDKKIKTYGFVVVKVIIPQLHPLYLDERYPYLGGDRLYRAPIEMGILQSLKAENQLNKIPHPFL